MSEQDGRSSHAAMSATTIIEMATMAANNRAGLSARMGARPAEETAEFAVEALLAAGLLITPQQQAVLDAAGDLCAHWRKPVVRSTEYMHEGQAARAALIAAVDALGGDSG